MTRAAAITARLEALAEERKALLAEYHALPGGPGFPDHLEELYDEIDIAEHDFVGYLMRKTHMRGVGTLRTGWVSREYWHRWQGGRGGLATRAIRRWLKWCSNPAQALKQLDAPIGDLIGPDRLACWEIKTLGSKRSK